MNNSKIILILQIIVLQRPTLSEEETGEKKGSWRPFEQESLTN